MKKSQRKFLYNYLIQQKWVFLVEVGTGGLVEGIGKVCRRVNMVEILCVHMEKWKNETW
jgi:hypothetical protein